METIFELWGKRNPNWEKRYQESVMNVFTDYGKGNNQFQTIRGKVFGAGYEIFIIAYFIGLYHNQTKPLVDDKSKVKDFGYEISKWGNIENRYDRTAYPRIREYIFASLVAKTDIDWIALDKGDITVRSVVDKLIDKMEQYANFGFDYIEEQLERDPNYYFKEFGFLKSFLPFIEKVQESEELDDDVPESLDDELIEDEIQKSIDSLMAPGVTAEKVEEEKAKHWYDDEVDFEVKAYRKGFEFWAKCAIELEKAEIVSANDCDFIKNMAILMSKDKALTENQMRKLYKVVQSAEERGFDFI